MVRHAVLGILLATSALVPGALAQAKKDSVVIAMVLEPAPGLDPTAAPAAAIGEVTHFNIFEGLTRITENGTVQPYLADDWMVSPDNKTWTFKLRRNVKFHDGTAFDSTDVKAAFERYGSEKSTNKNKATFANMEAITAPDPATVIIRLKEVNAILPFDLGLATAVITAPESAENNATKPIGTGPFKFDRWVKGDSITLVAAETWRTPSSVKIKTVRFRFISDPNAGVAAMLAGDVDAFPQFNTYEAVKQFEADPRFTVTTGTTEGETILSINNGKKPFDDVRVRRAIAHAIDRNAIIAGALYGFGMPIGSHFPPHNPAYVDLTGLYPHDVAKAKALLAEAGYPNGIDVSLRLPPPVYARRGGEVVAAQLAQAGIRAKIENVDFPLWLDQVFTKKNFDLTIIAHVEPNDLDIYTRPNYYFSYDNAEYNALIAKLKGTVDEAQRKALQQQAQRKLAEDSVNGFLLSLPRITITKKGLTGFWKNAPIFANDLTRVAWQ
jgi:peptide/nickel transport system substrate-binding protein